LDEILMPAVRFAIAQLRRITPPAAEKVLTKSAWNDLNRDLFARLALALTPTLRLQQTAAKAVTRSLPVDHNGRRRRARHGNITLLETIIEFPDLLETAAQLISAWIDAQRELFARLLQDKADLCSSFLHAREPFRIAHVRPRLSDPHDGGRTATMVEFIGDRRVIYKPRRPDREKLWFEALRWLNRNGIRVSFRAPKMLSRPDYVWMEFLQTKGCKSFAAVRLFYFRWGAQAALAQILGAMDLHRDNWLAIGSQPILVDAELIGDAETTSSREKRGSNHRQFLPALLQTGLLPLVSGDRAGFYRGIAPLDGAILKDAPPKCWPRYGRTSQEPSTYVSDLLRGFEAVVGIFATPGLARKFFREVILRAPWNKEGRVLLRASAVYGRLLRESFEARNMICAGERWRRLVGECCASAVNRRVGLAEARALLRSDIPKFMMPRRPPPSWRGFLAGIAELKRSSRLLRGRVLLRTRIRRA
jgi:lantibiotic modifying enzyme